MGNLTRDPEVKYLPNGTAATDASIAINHKYKTPAGELREDVTFVDCVAFGKTAENLGQYFTKGKPIYIEGRLRLETWDDKTTGQKRSKMRVLIERWQFIESGGKREESNPTQPDESDAPQKPRSAPKPPHDPDLDVQEEEIPF